MSSVINSFLTQLVMLSPSSFSGANGLPKLDADDLYCMKNALFFTNRNNLPKEERDIAEACKGLMDYLFASEESKRPGPQTHRVMRDAHGKALHAYKCIKASDAYQHVEDEVFMWRHKRATRKLSMVSESPSIKCLSC